MSFSHVLASAPYFCYYFIMWFHTPRDFPLSSPNPLTSLISPMLLKYSHPSETVTSPSLRYVCVSLHVGMHSLSVLIHCDFIFIQLACTCSFTSTHFLLLLSSDSFLCAGDMLQIISSIIALFSTTGYFLVGHFNFLAISFIFFNYCANSCSGIQYQHITTIWLMILPKSTIKLLQIIMISDCPFVFFFLFCHSKYVFLYGKQRNSFRIVICVCTCFLNQIRKS